MWVSDLCPHATNSLASRNLIAVIPSSRYVFDESGVNLTIQSALRFAVDSFNKLSSDGAKVIDPLSKEVESFKQMLNTILFSILYILAPVDSFEKVFQHKRSADPRLLTTTGTSWV